MAFKAGDIVIIEDIREVMFGDEFFTEGKPLRVMAIDRDGDVRLEADDYDSTLTPIEVDGVPTFLVTEDEFHALTLVEEKANKPVFTQEQAGAYEQFTRIRAGFAMEAFVKNHGEFTGQYASLNDVSIEEFARVLYDGGYELNEEDAYWASLGREVAEFRHGDIFIDKNGNDVEGTPEYATFLYERGDFAGLYPAESFRPYGKDVR